MALEPGIPVSKHGVACDDQVSDVYDDGYLRVEYDKDYIACGGNRISLPLKEFRVFSRLARSADRVVPSEEIWRAAWVTRLSTH